MYVWFKGFWLGKMVWVVGWEREGKGEQRVGMGGPWFAGLLCGKGTRIVYCEWFLFMRKEGYVEF